ncbi:MAG TPA: large exoprotein, partial [Microbacterium sp.]|nr:large exoprotein [Microbacterium sp.]
MGGQILGGGVIALVVVMLWLIYLLPTWYARVRDNAAERNAVRLNQALRVLAESSEASDDVRIQLSSREVARQRRLVKKL